MIRTAAVALVIFFGTAVDQAMSAEGPGAARVASPVSLDGRDTFRDIAAMAVARSRDQLGRPGGFYLTPKFHIPLPDGMTQQVRTLDRGYASILYVAVEKALNRAAEETVAPAADFVTKALATESFADSQKALHGRADGITNEMKAQLESSFRQAMRPLVMANLAKAGAPAALERMQARYEQITKTAFPDFDLTEYTLDHLVEVFFASLADQERTIRLRIPNRS